MEQHQDSILAGHLTSLIDELERKLAFPKNDWRRKEQLQAELTDAHQRLATLSRPHRKFNRDGLRTTREHRSSHGRTQQVRMEASIVGATTSVSRSRPQKLEINYR